jgi:uncharacterized phage protein gp47/JayE
MTNNYIGINGLVTQDLQQIRDDLIAKFLDIYPLANLEQNSPDGQWLNILAQEKKDILDLFTTYYNNLDPDRVVGIPQQILYKLNGLTVNAYTYSYVLVNVLVSEDVTLQGLDENLESADGVGYTVKDGNGNRWILAETQELAPGSHSLNFRAAELGSITALPNTINIMETVIKGVTSVNNPATNYITGDQGETSAQFRRRRNRAMSVASQGFDESLESQMLNLPNVTQCKVYSNRTGSIVDGIPAHGVWVIVEGGESNRIGETIYNNVPPGIPIKQGAESVIITKQNGSTETVYYDTPTAVTLYIRGNIKSFDGTLDTTYIINQLIEQLDYNIGERADSATITAILKEIIADTGTVYGIELSLTSDFATLAEYLTPTGLDEFLQATSSSVTLTPV